MTVVEEEGQGKANLVPWLSIPGPSFFLPRYMSRCRIVESGSLSRVPRALAAAVELYNKNKMQIIRNSRGQGGFNLR